MEVTQDCVAWWAYSQYWTFGCCYSKFRKSMWSVIYLNMKWKQWFRVLIN